jgi:hypothetical protein
MAVMIASLGFRGSGGWRRFYRNAQQRKRSRDDITMFG